MVKHSRKDITAENDGEDLYTVLGIQSSASLDEIKKAYRVLALKWHPDRSIHSCSEEATKKFQDIGRAYGILSDPVRKKLYDETGTVDSFVAGSEGEEWFDYWRALYPKITIRDIQEFEKKYKGSDEEFADLKEAYLKHKGDMDLIMEEVILAEPDDEDRFRDMLNEAIGKKELKKFKLFTDEPASRRAKRRKAALKEAKEAEEMAKEMGTFGKSDDELQKIIQSRSRSNYENMIADLEAKYSKPKSSGARNTKKH